MNRRMYGVDILVNVGFRSVARSSIRPLPNAIRGTKFAAGTAVAVALILGTWARAAWAQETKPVSITVPPVLRAEAGSNSQLSIRVGPQETLTKNSSIRISGLPPVIAVSSGYAVAPGAWSVPLAAVPGLTILVPVGAQGKSDVVIDLVKDDGSVLAKARTELIVAPASQAHANHQPTVATAAIKPELDPSPRDPSPLAAIRKGFDTFLAKRRLTTDQSEADTKTALTADQKAEMFRLFLTWPQNPLEVEVVVRLTSEGGVGNAIGSVVVKNSEVLVAGRKEPALILKPNLRGLQPGKYAFHVHENPNCGPALKDGIPVPGLAAGAHLWLSGTGQLSGTSFTSHLGNLPNLEVNADGTATKAVVATRMSLADVTNRALMIHANQDDNSARMACGRLN
jgi:superoxide dismutase, Cu-Zn family